MKEDKNNPTSPRKRLANRSNAQHSTGPRTEAGKAKAAQNSYKHGFFALRLFPNDKLRAQDAADYNMVYSGLYSTNAEAPQQPTETVPSLTPPPEIHETNPPFSSRWVETAEDQKLIDKLHKELYGTLP